MLATLLAGASLFVSILIVFTPLVWWLKAIAVFGIVMACLHHIHRDALLKSTASWQQLTQHGKGNWVATSAVDAHAIRIMPYSVVTAVLTIVCFKLEKRWLPSAVVILPDRADQQELRRLRVWLRWAYREGEVGDDASV